MVGIFFSVAVLLVVFGGLLAAADAALSVLSRTDLVELAAQAQVGRDAGEVLRLLGAVERDADAGAARAARPADAVDVAVAVGGRVGGDDVRDADACRRTT